jgi:putative ABC transport system permease protein
VATAAIGLVITALAALVPAALLRRLPTARLLAEE